ncbi:carotenoid biosynthesis protein [Waterburya agarophytonicola K14]|uniref:Carotenoid biosynthesis protein n=1 Tax=Waterburya agarophytonicola KI4 TaxID=2874699 RepID=A0A964FFE1_9CYAN|nr:carotenoid biosynthesis protein [Waterburya agarophytonicola]MCC0175724.1 carotenoid biosynthesis protein [Waterburya agarophytonicola KI4]
MKRISSNENYLLIGHILAMVFGLAGIILVLPNPDFLVILSQFEWGTKIFGWSMAGGGVVYMLLATAAVSLYAYRTLGLWHWLSFMLPAIGLSLGSELLGTSTGFPFGEYRYLSGLGYKIAGLVPFTIPLSWFYLGFSAYIIALAGLNRLEVKNWLCQLGAIFCGSLCLTSWDFVLDPAMSQAPIPFWVWEQPGAFFGMPYQNFAGWMGTGIIFMTVATLLWKIKPLTLPTKDLKLPLAIYLANFVFATVLSLAAGFYIPVLLGLVLGVFPLIILYWIASNKNVAFVKNLATTS